MYKSALSLCSLCAVFLLQASAPITRIPPLQRQFHRKQLTQTEIDTLAKTLGTETARLFAANATKSDKEKRDLEKGGQAPVIIMLTPKQGSPKNNYMAKKAHNTKTPGARCCGLSNESN